MWLKPHWFGLAGGLHEWQRYGSGRLYADYFTSLAAALLRGAKLETLDHEGYWSKFGYTAHMGIPNTAQRAVNEAVRKRFAGVGSWKADDGNLYSMFPHIPQIGRVTPKL